MTRIKSKIYIALALVLSIVLGCLGISALLFAKNKDDSIASTNYQGVNFSVEKVNRFAQLDLYGTDPNSAAYFSTEIQGGNTTSEETVFPITTNDTAVMLNNAEIEESSIIEAVKITLLPSDNYIIWLSPTITLNGTPINCSGDGINDYGTNTGTIKYSDPNITEDCFKFVFYIDLTNIKDLHDNSITDTNGYYDITINYHYKYSNSQTTSSENTINFGLYILDEVDYINSTSTVSTSDETAPRDNVNSTNAITEEASLKNVPADYAFQGFYNNNYTRNSLSQPYSRLNVEPRLSNTERIDRYVISSSTEDGQKNYYVNYKPGNTAYINGACELNFFNFNNESTTDYNGNSTVKGENLLFPTYIYDASKYNISWEYTYKSTEHYTVTSKFEIFNDVGTVTFYKDGTFMFSVSAVEDNGMYIVEVPFTEIGEYEFSVRYTVRQFVKGSTIDTSTLSNTYYVIDRLSDKVKTVDTEGNVKYVYRDKDYLIGDVKLSIFGYELYYTDEDNTITNEDNSTTYKLSKFRNVSENYKYITDYTYLNLERVNEEKAGRVQIESAENTEKVNAYQSIYNLNVKNDSYITKGEVTQINLGEFTDLSSTNQAPVEFKYLGNFAIEEEKTNYSYSYYIYYQYGKDSTEGVQINQVTNSTRFTSNGTYDVVVMYNYYNYKYYDYTVDKNGNKVYNYNVQSASDFVHVQIFTFEIANTPPKITISTIDTEKILNKDDYTNESVKITVEKSNSPFNVAPILACEFVNFDTQTVSKINLNEIDDGVYTATDTGKYIITVYYGQNHKSHQSTEFYIDKTPIKNPKLYNSKGTTLPTNLTNANFYLTYSEKASGAPISVQYAYIPIKQITIDVSNIFATNDESVIKNGYQMAEVYSGSTTYTKDSVINTPGFYFFTLTDKAGNKAYKFAFYDTTSPLILQKETKENGVETDWYLATYMNNIVTNNTTIRWGTTKAIMLNTYVQAYLSQIVKTSLEEYSTVLDTYAKTLSQASEKVDYSNQSDLNYFYSTFCANKSVIRNYAQLTIDHIKVVFAGSTTIVLEITSASAIKEKQEVTFYTVAPSGIVVDDNLVAANSPTSVRLYEATVYDTLGNNRRALVEVNLDNSLVLIYSYNKTSVSYTENNENVSVNYLRLYNRENHETKYGTNRESVYITFKDGLGKYKIESLSYSFYNLNLEDGTSSQFPYNDIASIKDYIFDLENDSITHSGQNGLSNKNNLMIGPLNTTSNNITTQGIYVVKRVYVGDESEYIGTGDTKEKIYTFLIDRTGIVTILDDQTIGEHITLGFGVTSSNSALSAKIQIKGLELLVDVGAGSSIFTSNIVPIFYNIPENKYYFSSALYSTLKPLNLEVKVYYDKTGYGIFDKSNLQDSSFIIYQEGSYKIVISDSTGFNTSTELNLHATYFEFVFSIEYKDPEGNFTKIIEASDGTELETDIPNEITSVNSKTLSFYWTDPLSKYDAEIDATKVTVTQYTEGGGSGRKIYSNTTSSHITFSNSTVIEKSGKLVTKYILNMDYYAQVEGKYVVHLEYKLPNASYLSGNEKFYEDIVIWVDTTSPNYNASNLIVNDKFLTNVEKQNLLTSIIKTYRTEDGSQYYINFENYVFTVDENFMLTSMPEGFWLTKHDTYSAYIRKYDRDLRENSTSDGSTLQSLIPSDKHYGEANYSTQFNFSPQLLDKYGNLVYTPISYDSKINLIEDYGAGYYEIIEVDEAGNTTIYTVYVQPEGEEIFELKYQDSLGRTYTAKKEDGASKIEINDKNIEMVFTSLTSKLDWFKVSLRDATNTNHILDLTKTYKKATLLENEYNNFDDILSLICEFVKLNEELKIKGASFTITIYHPSNTNRNYVVVYNTPGDLVEPKFEIVDSPKTLIVTVPQITHTYIKKIVIYQGGVDASGNSTSSLYATFIPDFNKNQLSYSIPAASGISYLFLCTDNFDRSYYRIKNVDIVDAQDLIFSGVVKGYQGVNYTASSVTLRYQTKLYKLGISIDGVALTNDEISKTFTFIQEGNGIYSYQLVSNTPELNQNKLFEIYLTPILQPTTNEEIVIQPKTFRLYTILPEVNLYTSAGKSLNYAINGSTAKDIYLSYSNKDILFDVSVDAECLEADGKYRTYSNLKNGSALTIDGTYTITIYNSLGAKKSFVVVKKPNSDPYYTIYKYNHTENDEKLQMANTKYNTMIDSKSYFLDWYFSTFIAGNEESKNVDISLNEDLNITYRMHSVVDYEVEGKTYTTKIYYIYTNTDDPDKLVYQKYIAVTFVDTSNELLLEFMASNANNPESTPKPITSASASVNTSLQVTFIEEKVKITWTPFFEVPENLIYVEYYYNGELAGRAYDGLNGIILMESGVYELEFKDFAGNIHMFGTNGATSKSFYTITMYNEILYTMNGESPIDNCIYNGDVTLDVLDTENLKNLRFTATLNGEPLTLTRTQTTHTLTAFGYYEITIDAEIQYRGRFVSLTNENANLDRATISSTICFTILNADQARFAYAYSGNTIYSIYFNDENVTTKVLNGLTQSPSVVLSSDTLGYGGIFTIYAKQVFDGLRPDAHFSFKVWINNETPIITSNIEMGESTTKELYIYFNPYIVYNQVGVCNIVVKTSIGKTLIYDIDPANQDIEGEIQIVNEKMSIELKDIATYIVQVEVNGNTLTSFVVTKAEKLNTVAIIVICIVVATLIVGGFIFFKLRTRMRVK